MKGGIINGISALRGFCNPELSGCGDNQQDSENGRFLSQSYRQAADAIPSVHPRKDRADGLCGYGYSAFRFAGQSLPGDFLLCFLCAACCE